MASIQFKEIRKSYGDVKVVHGISLDIEDGEFIVIVGPSGCGKSTLLRMVAGLEPITSGELLIGDRVVNRLEPKDRDCAMVFQNYALYPHMTVYDNMAYGLKIRGIDKAEIDRRVNEAAEMLQLTGLLERRPRQLSGGQRQRVAMGRAIVREPSVFLFDEPLSNLDAKLRVQTRLQIKRLQERLCTTSLYVTHDQVEAMTLAHRMIVMNGGVAEQVGTPKEVYDDPATMFVAGFIGSPPMNLVRGRVSAGGTHFEADGERVRLPEAVPSLAGRDLVFGIRPEHVTMLPVADADALGTFRVETVEGLGSEYLVHGTMLGSTVVFRVNVDAFVPEAGSSCAIDFPAKAVHWFDPETTKRVRP